MLEVGGDLLRALAKFENYETQAPRVNNPC